MADQDGRQFQNDLNHVIIESSVLLVQSPIEESVTGCGNQFDSKMADMRDTRDDRAEIDDLKRSLERLEEKLEGRDSQLTEGSARKRKKVDTAVSAGGWGHFGPPTGRRFSRPLCRRRPS